MVGAAAVIAGQSHLTYSLAVIMLETTQSINLFLPVITSIIVAQAVAKLIQPESIYKKAIKMKNIPLLPEDVPRE